MLIFHRYSNVNTGIWEYVLFPQFCLQEINETSVSPQKVAPLSNTPHPVGFERSADMLSEMGVPIQKTFAYFHNATNKFFSFVLPLLNVSCLCWGCDTSAEGLYAFYVLSTAIPFCNNNTHAVLLRWQILEARKNHNDNCPPTISPRSNTHLRSNQPHWSHDASRNTS